MRIVVAENKKLPTYVKDLKVGTVFRCAPNNLHFMRLPGKWSEDSAKVLVLEDSIVDGMNFDYEVSEFWTNNTLTLAN